MNVREIDQLLRKPIQARECERLGLPNGSTKLNEIWKMVETDKVGGARALAALRKSGYEPNPEKLCRIPFLPSSKSRPARRAHSRRVIPPRSIGLIVEFLRELARAHADDWTFVSSIPRQRLPYAKVDLPKAMKLKDAPAEVRARFEALKRMPVIGFSRGIECPGLSRAFEPAAVFSILANELEVIAARKWVVTSHNPQHNAIAQLVWGIHDRTGNPHTGHTNMLLDAIFRATSREFTMDPRELRERILDREGTTRRAGWNKLNESAKRNAPARKRRGRES